MLALRHSIYCLFMLTLLVLQRPCVAQPPRVHEPGMSPQNGIGWIEVSADKSHFVEAATGKRLVLWGVNYDHDDDGRLLEDYWTDHWDTVVSDLREINALGANVVRIHLQLGKFMETAEKPNHANLARLGKLVQTAQQLGLYLDLTGLGCYHKSDVPAWYDALPEVERWNVQARFWKAVARQCQASPAVFCYDLMNEPILPGKQNPETEWLTGELAGKYFVQRIALDLAGRTRRSRSKVGRSTCRRNSLR